MEHRLRKMRTLPFGKAVEQRDEAFFGETALQLTAAPALTAVLAQRIERPMRPHQATGSRPPPGAEACRTGRHGATVGGFQMKTFRRVLFATTNTLRAALYRNRP